MNSTLNHLIALLHDSEKMMPSFEYVVEDIKIINLLDDFEDINVTDSNGRTLLMYSIIYEREKVVEYLLKRNANVELEEKKHFRALHFAAQSGNYNILLLLLNAGVEVNAQNCYGNNALMLCNYATEISVIELLLSFGANPYQKNNFGISPSDIFAASEKISEVIRNFTNRKTD